MKNFNKIQKTVMIILVFASISLNSFSQVNLEDGLIGYYPFNGNANDESTNSNDGIVFEAILTADRFGNENSAYKFDGDNDNIYLGTNVYSSNAGTIAAWIYLDNIDERLPIFSQGDIYNDYNSMRFTIWDDSLSLIVDHRTCDNSSDFPTIKTYTKIPAGQWVHVAVTSDGSVHKFYINGVLSDYHTVIAAQGEWFDELCSGGKDTYIGRWKRPSNDENFNGKIDELRIYNRAVNQDEILALYNMTNSVNNINQNIISVIPSVVSDKIKIKSSVSLDNAVIEIFSITGQTAYKSLLKNKKELDVSSLKTGIYIVKITSDNNKFIQKIIKK